MTKLSKRDFKKYTDRATQVLKDNDRVEHLLDQATSYLKSMLSDNHKLRSFSDKVYTVIRMLKAQITGEYTHFPWRSLLLMAGALLYFITPTDLLPDFMPVFGFTDDIAIMVWVYNSLREEIELFENWENTLDIQITNESKETQ